MLNFDDLTPSPTANPPSATPEVDPLVALQELNAAIQLLREIVKGCHQDWMAGKDVTWIAQARASWGANIISVDSFLTAVEQKMATLTTLTRPHADR